MIKKLGILLVLGIFAAAGIKGYASYAAMQFIEQLKRENITDLSLTYRWLSADFQGNISYEGIVVTPYSLKRPITIESLTFQFGDINTMLTSLSGFMSGKLPAPLTITYSGLSMPLQGRGIDEWLALSYGNKALLPTQLYSCGDRSHLDFASLKAMGIDEIRAKGQVYIEQENNEEALRFILDIEKMGKFDFSITLNQGSMNSLFQKREFNGAAYSEMTLKYLDAGYYRRLTNLCTEKNDMEADVYAALSAKHWRVAMAKEGIIVNEGAERLYRDRFLQGGAFSLESKPQSPIKFGTFESLLDQDLVSLLGLSTSLNGERRDSIQLFLDGKHFRPEQTVEQKEKIVEGGQATVILSSASYQRTEINQLPEFLERKVRIHLLDGKSYQGMLKSADEKKLEVTLLFNAGTADYSFGNEKVEYVEVWR